MVTEAVGAEAETEADAHASTTSRSRLRIATYNVHGCVVRGGRFDPLQTAEVVRELRADVVGLQEVYSGEGATSPLRVLSEATGLEAVFGETLTHRGFAYGNAVLTSRRVLDVQRHDLSVAGREPRGALETTLDVLGRRVSFFVTHLGLRSHERWQQCQHLAELIGARTTGLIALAGDMNEWNRFARSLRAIGRMLGPTPAPRTFPAGRPWLALDRIWVRPRLQMVDLFVHDTPLARRASDHLPLSALVDVGVDVDVEGGCR